MSAEQTMTPSGEGGDSNTTPSTQTPGILRNLNSGRNNRGNGGNSRRNRGSSSGSTNGDASSTQLKSFKGVTPEVGAVLCLSNEDVDRGREGFVRFQLKLEEYVLREYNNAKDVTPLIVLLKDPVVPFEKRNFPKAKYTVDEMKEDPIKKKMVENSVNAYTTRLADLEQNIVCLYGHIWGQCTPALQAELKANAQYTEKRVEYDALWLLLTAKKLIASVDNRGNKHYNAYKLLMEFNRTYQKENESEQAWLDRFQAAVETLSLAGCDHIFYSNELCSLPSGVDKDDDEAVQAAIDIEKQKFQAMYFFMRSDKSKFGQLQDNYYLDMIKGQDNYPTTVTAAYDVLLQYVSKPEHSGRSRRSNGSSSGAANAQPRVSFAMVRLINGTEVEVDRTCKIAGADGQIVERPCFNCGKWGHIVHQCPDLTESERQESRDRAAARRAGNQNTRQTTSHLQVVHSFVQNSDLISPTVVMLDSCSESSVFMNRDLVHDLRPCSQDEKIILVTNGNGSIVFEETAIPHILPGFRVHFNPSSMANILSLRDVASLPGVRITMDSSVARAINVHLPSGMTYVFNEASNGLYVMDVSSIGNVTNPIITNYSPSFLSTVSDNQAHFTRLQIEGANNARLLHEQIGWPSLADFKRYISTNSILNCKVTLEDVDRAEFIYGTPLPILKGKMTRPSPKYKPPTLAILPPHIKQHHSNIELYVDFFYVNQLPFLHTKSRHVNFLTVQQLKSRSKNEIIAGIKEVIKMYTTRGFSISTIHGDNEFNIDEIIEELRPIRMQFCARNEHVGVAERSIRTIKERARSICHALPFQRFTKLMTTALVETATYWLNTFPAKDGVSETMSPRGIVVGGNNIDVNYPMVEYGAYSVVYDTTKNNMMARATPAIALKRSNDRGGHYFMSIDTGKKIHGSKWVVKPINQDVIDRVHALAKKEKQPLLVNNTPLFEYNIGRPVGNDNISDEESDLGDDLSLRSDGDVENHEGIDDPILDNDPEELNLVTDDDYDDASNHAYEEDHSHDGNDVHIEENEDPSNEEHDVQHEAEDLNNDHVQDGEDTGEHGDAPNLQESEPESNDEHISNEVNEVNRDVSENEELGTKVEGGVRRSTRANRALGVNRLTMHSTGKKYRSQQSLQYLMKKQLKKSKMDPKLVDIACKVMFVQMSARKGIKMFGEEAVAALMKEYSQLDQGAMKGKPVICPINPDQLSMEQKKRAMNVVNLIQKKRCGKIKGRACADGSRQRRYINEEEKTASPTVNLETVHASFCIDAHEKRFSAITDIPGAYLHAGIPEDKEILLKFVGQFVDILCRVNPEYAQYVRYENNVKVLYVKVLRAIYGCIFSALLWYELFSSTLEEMGFKINPYDRCVANKTVGGKQCTIIWYVDDLKISHVDKRVVMDVIRKLEGKFGDLQVQTGPKYNFLGIDYEITKNGTVEIIAENQINEAIEMFPEEINRKVRSPAGHGLFEVNDKDELLHEKQAEMYHSLVMKLMWIEKRARPDIETAVSFLSTRVSQPNMGDWRKLKRVLQYLKTTIHLKRIIGADNLHSLFTWIDASYAIHPNMRSHTGGCMSMGIGTLHCKSSKQKLNTKSSTEAEVVGLSEYSPYNLWLVNFMKEQGYQLKTNDIYQDNQSAIKMERNGRNSCTGNSRHIHIRYFFVKDRQDKGEIDIKYCPTENMLADFFTKPLQGTLFERFRAVIMGHAHISTLSTPFKERVRISNDDEKLKSEIKVNGGTQLKRAGIGPNPTGSKRKPTFCDVVKRNLTTGIDNTLLVTRMKRNSEIKG